MHPEISIIVPAYNAERWIGRCLDSISNQSFPHFEALCVNDASTDSSLKILEEYARKDPRIIVIDLPANRGEGGARNAGLEVARGKYIGFIDSDDTVDIDFYDSLYSRAETSGADMIGAPMRIICERNQQQEIPHSWFCSSIFRADFLQKNTILFPAKYLNGDDSVFMARVFLAKPKRHQVNNVFYNYHQISSSVSHHQTDEKCASRIAAFLQIFSEIERTVDCGRISSTYAQYLFSDFFLYLLRFISFNSTQTIKYYAAKVLSELFLRYPHRANVVKELSESDPIMLKHLESGDVNQLADYFKSGRQRFAASLRASLKNTSQLP